MQRFRILGRETQSSIHDSAFSDPRLAVTAMTTHGPHPKRALVCALRCWAFFRHGKPRVSPKTLVLSGVRAAMLPLLGPAGPDRWLRCVLHGLCLCRWPLPCRPSRTHAFWPSEWSAFGHVTGATSGEMASSSNHSHCFAVCCAVYILKAASGSVAWKLECVCLQWRGTSVSPAGGHRCNPMDATFGWTVAQLLTARAS